MDVKSLGLAVCAHNAGLSDGGACAGNGSDGLRGRSRGAKAGE